MAALEPLRNHMDIMTRTGAAEARAAILAA